MDELEPGVEIRDMSPIPHRLVDEEGQGLTAETLDLSRGHVVSRPRILADHPAVEHAEAVTHFEVGSFYFVDGSSYEPTGADDPHVRVIDDKRGVFDYADQGEGKVLLGIDLKTIVDVPEVEGHPRYYEVEYQDVYVEYNDEELARMQAERERQAKQSAFLSTGPERLDTTETNVEDLTLMMAEMIGA